MRPDTAAHPSQSSAAEPAVAGIYYSRPAFFLQGEPLAVWHGAKSEITAQLMRVPVEVLREELLLLRERNRASTRTRRTAVEWTPKSISDWYDSWERCAPSNYPYTQKSPTSPHWYDGKREKWVYWEPWSMRWSRCGIIQLARQDEVEGRSCGAVRLPD